MASKYKPMDEERTSGDENTSDRNKINLNIALVAEIESGKSSFINAILGREEGDKNAAGIYEKSNEAVPYTLNRDITLWDHPGHDTLKCDIQTYFEKYFLERFDGFLLFIKGSYTETDKGLAKKLCSIKKPFLIVRTKIDECMPRRETGADNRKKILNDKRENVLELFKDLTISDAAKRDPDKKIFIISCHQPQNPNWDFRLLKEAILTEFLPSPTNGTDDPSLSELREKKREAQDEFKECHGPEELREKIIIKLEEWQYEEIKLAMVGISGVGKSSLINALRGMDNSKHPDYAKTGVTETTLKPREYPFPKNRRITLCDLPGVGSSKYSNVPTYDDKLKLDRYDEFVIVTATRFYALDNELVKLIVLMKKPFIFVRTKIDSDCANEALKPGFNKQKMLDDVRSGLAKEVQDVTSQRMNSIYLISNHDPNHFDFPKLVSAIRENLPENKKTAFIFSTDIFSKEHLKVKLKELKSEYQRY